MLPKFIGSVKDIDISTNETKYFANVAIRPEEKRVVEIVKAQGVLTRFTSPCHVRFNNVSFDDTIR